MDSVPTEASWMKEDETRERSEWTRPRESTSRPKRTDSSHAEKKAIREMNKRLKAVYEDEGREYGSDASDEETLLDRFTVATKLRKVRIEEVFRNIRRARDVQLCFLVDATGSMQPHIDGVRKSVQDIVQKLTDSGPHVAFRNSVPEAQSMNLAFVAYRDHCDSNQFEILPFTRSVEALKSFCSNIRASGGGDTPEDVFGGLDAALNLAWSPNCGTKVIFHICDAPCHGNEYHSASMHDSYPTGDPKGRTGKGLFSILREKGIQYHFGKITGDTDIMISKFGEAYGEPITEFDVKKVDDIRESVITAVSTSIFSSVSSSMRTVGAVRKEREFTMDTMEPNWTKLDSLKGTFVSYEFPNSIEDIKDDIPLDRKKPKSALVKIADKPFGKGAERIAFYGMDVSTYVPGKVDKGKEAEVLTKAEKIVLKEYLHRGKGMNSAKRYELSNQMQTIASYLAQEFVKELETRANIKKTIKFIKIRTLSVPVGASFRYMSCERRFSADDKFVRFTNNAGYRIMEEKAVRMGVPLAFVQLVMAFSHWTYKATDKFLMVVDLEGVVGKIGADGDTGVLLTDPAIHCKDVTRYGAMNHGTHGMKSFFEHHECNQFCKDLGLDRFD